MGKTKADAGCNWVRARLPLWVGDRDSRTERNGEGGDLSLPEHQRIERHLDHCSTCRWHCAALERSLATLAAAAANLPVEPQAPSLWPALKQRIEDLEQSCPSHGIGALRALANRWARRAGEFITDQPMRRSWAYDSLRATVASQGNGWRGSNRRAGLVLGFGLIASLLLAVSAVPGLWREWANAQSTIQANALPLADHGVASAERDFEPRPDPSRSEDGEPQDDLVQADVARPVETPSGGVASSSEAKPTTPARYGYDLEHGIPMPPDARESKPVY